MLRTLFGECLCCRCLDMGTASLGRISDPEPRRKLFRARERGFGTTDCDRAIQFKLSRADDRRRSAGFLGWYEALTFFDSFSNR
jgi:hypothetical protein